MSASFARAGYVVVVPQLDGINFSPDGDAVLIRRVIDWMHDGWEHASVLAPPERTAVIGHSRGAVNAAHVAAGGGIGAFVWLSGDTFAVNAEDLVAIQVPKLFVFGNTEALDRSWAPPVDGATRPSGTWQRFSLPRHAALVHGLEHFDYLAPNVSPCAAAPGSCAHVGRAVADLVTLFLGRHLAGSPAPATPRSRGRCSSQMTGTTASHSSRRSSPGRTSPVMRRGRAMAPAGSTFPSTTPRGAGWHHSPKPVDHARSDPHRIRVCERWVL